jgi:hypothetical protein
MPETKKTGGRFAGLRALREQASENLDENSIETDDLEVPQETSLESQEQVDPAPAPVEAYPSESTPQSGNNEDSHREIAKPQEEKRSPGRPRGRRSDPDYTQISAYIPLDLLLDIQNELNQEKRFQRKRTAMSVSELVEDLLADWLKERNSESPK